MSSTNPKLSSSIALPLAAEPALGTLRLETIHAPKPSEILAANLRDQILDGTLKDGTVLPAERDLVDQTGLTRGSVRDALRILQAEGLVETRTGRFGGSLIRRPSDDALAKYLGLFIQGRSISLLSLLQLREAIGGTIASLAAINRSDDDIARLHDIGRRLEETFDDPPTFLQENVNWQIAVAGATHNELFKALITAISSLLLKATSMEHFASADIRRIVIKAHERILKAIVERDSETASRRMTRHLASVTKLTQSSPTAPFSLT